MPSRKNFANYLEAVPASNVNGQPLKPLVPEKIFARQGFMVFQYVDTIKNENSLGRFQVQPLTELLVKMAHVFGVFGYEICCAVLHSIDEKRLVDLNYAVSDKKEDSGPEGSGKQNPGPEGELLTFTQLMCAAASRAEKEFGVHRSQKKAEEEKSDGNTNMKNKGKKFKKCVTPPSPPLSPIKSYAYDSVSPVFGKVAKFSSGKGPIGVNSELVEIGKEASVTLRPSDLLIEAVDYKTFAKYYLVNQIFGDLVYKRKVRSPVEKSIFDDPFGGPLTAVDNRITYQGRTEVGTGISETLDLWWGKYNSKEFCDATVVFDNGEYKCKALDVYEVLSNNWASAEVVACFFRMIQRLTPTATPWVFIKPYTITTIHHTPYADILQTHPFLFNKQFELTELILVPLVGAGHWVLLVVNIQEKTMTFYNSLGRSGRNRYYENLHRMFLAWLKNFLVWRTELEDWISVVPTWATGFPKQENTVNCGFFVVRYAHYIVTGNDMNFSKDDIKKDRAVLVLRLLLDSQNKVRFDPDKPYAPPA